jgi:hypothetical protein
MASFGAEMKVIRNLCGFCVEVFCQTNELKQHLQANHSHAASKPRVYFELLLDSQKKLPKKLRNIFLFLTKL